MIRGIQLIQSSSLKRSDNGLATVVATDEEGESRILPSASKRKLDIESGGTEKSLVKAATQRIGGPETSRRDSPSTTTAQLYGEACGFVTDTLEHLRAGRSISLLRAHSIGSRILSDLESDTGLLRLALERDVPFSIPQHSANVAIVAVRIGQTLGWSQERLHRLVLAGLMHDVGVVRMPASFFSRPDSFTGEDRLNLVQRPLHSAELLSGQSGFEWLASIVSQIHERENGSGYPLGLKISAICPEANVLGVADAFEACIHHRPHRAAFTGPETLQILTSDTQRFPEQITKAVIRSFSVYPYNEYVRLGTGETGVVTEINPSNPMRPVVKLLYSADGNPVSEPKVIDLIQHSQLSISSALEANELPRSAASAGAGRA